MAINPTLTNLLTISSSLYPIFIVSFLVIASIFNMTPLKGLTYLGGLGASTVLWALLAKLFDKSRDISAPLTCSLISIPGFDYKWPSLDVIITFFTFAYLLAPMIKFNHNINWSVITFLLVFSSLNMLYKVLQKCSDVTGVILGSVFGLLFGLCWFSIFWYSGKKDLLFYNELISNNVICNKPTKQTFKCSVYKNGEIVSSSVV